MFSFLGIDDFTFFVFLSASPSVLSYFFLVVFCLLWVIFKVQVSVTSVSACLCLFLSLSLSLAPGDWSLSPVSATYTLCHWAMALSPHLFLNCILIHLLPSAKITVQYLPGNPRDLCVSHPQPCLELLHIPSMHAPCHSDPTESPQSGQTCPHSHCVHL